MQVMCHEPRLAISRAQSRKTRRPAALAMAASESARLASVLKRSRGSCMLGGRKKETANQFFDVLAGPARWGHGARFSSVCLLVAETAMAEPPATIPLELTGQHQIDHATHHVQGVAVSAESYWISSVDRPARQGFVFRVDRDRQGGRPARADMRLRSFIPAASTWPAARCGCPWPNIDRARRARSYGSIRRRSPRKRPSRSMTISAAWP